MKDNINPFGVPPWWVRPRLEKENYRAFCSDGSINAERNPAEESSDPFPRPDLTEDEIVTLRYLCEKLQVTNIARFKNEILYIFGFAFKTSLGDVVLTGPPAVLPKELFPSIQPGFSYEIRSLVEGD